MLKIAFIGLGHVARYQIEATKYVHDIEVVGAHDIVSDRASILPSTVAFYESLATLIDNSGADVFIVSTPNKTHFEIGMEILQKDRSLLIEKPCAISKDDLYVLRKEIEQRRQFCAIALHASYALDLLWYLEQLEEGKINFGALNSFFSGFYDPYYVNGEIVQSAVGLCGSWIDSGINALSVIAKLIDMRNVVMCEGRMTRIASLSCSEIQGTASFEFLDKGRLGRGMIDTNWALGINRKRTHLYYEEGTEVILDHSKETVIVKRSNQIVDQKNLQNGLPRLVNHYRNLFHDLVHMYRQGESNFDDAYILHSLMLDAHNYTFSSES